MACSYGFDSLEQGKSLFKGTEPLTGKIREHETTLPPEVVVCANCHAGQKGKKLDADYLLQPHQRRGGPPSAYNSEKFCKLLRTGVDPAYIMIAREMPVYEISDTQCASLFRFLTSNVEQ